MAKSTTKRARRGQETLDAEFRQGVWRLGTKVPERLPFDVLEPIHAPNRGDDGQGMPGPGCFLWSNEAAHVAEAALEEGMILTVKVSPEEAVPATAAVVQNLTSNVWCVYNKRIGCLVLWDHEPQVAMKKRHDNGTPKEKQN